MTRFSVATVQQERGEGGPLTPKPSVHRCSLQSSGKRVSSASRRAVNSGAWLPLRIANEARRPIPIGPNYCGIGLHPWRCRSRFRQPQRSSRRMLMRPHTGRARSGILPRNGCGAGRRHAAGSGKTAHHHGASWTNSGGARVAGANRRADRADSSGSSDARPMIRLPARTALDPAAGVRRVLAARSQPASSPDRSPNACAAA
jgi:hypothetical protein